MIVGAAHSVIGEVGKIHEYGGVEYRSKVKSNWRLTVGGHGPVAVYNGRPVMVRLQTQRQVDRAKRIKRRFFPWVTVKRIRRQYPARPYVRPAVNKAVKKEFSRV